MSDVFATTDVSVLISKGLIYVMGNGGSSLMGNIELKKHIKYFMPTQVASKVHILHTAVADNHGR